MNARRSIPLVIAFVLVLGACTPAAQDGSGAPEVSRAAVASDGQPGIASSAPSSGEPGSLSPSAVAANPSCVPVGTKVAQGRDAVDRLGPRLEAAARRVGMSSARLRKTLLEDRTARVDGCGALFYVDVKAPAEAGGPDAVPSPQAAVLPYSSTFKLHSRPGSLRTIYLDFNGFRVDASAWTAAYGSGAAWDLLPYDTDGNGGSFSSAEQDVIQDVWRRVSEDYAPFDVDVTTEDPGFDAIDRSSTDDTRYGTRAVVTDDDVIGSTCGCGGLAYVGVFDSTLGTNYHHSYYQPALLFADNLSGGTSSKSIAEAASHEVGHNLGLNHDGTSTLEYYQGAGAWAPIMGVAYYRPLGQFSRGQYADADNTEDDLAVIAAHGLPAVLDDHADVRTSATSLSVLPAGAIGEISTAADVDWFSFTSSGGSVTVSATPAALSPNLDIKLSLYNSAGSLVSSADPASAFVGEDAASGLAATLTSTTSAGTYYVQVDGVGSGNVATTGYSDYASIGRYGLAVATNAAPVITTTVLSPTVVGQAYSQILTSAGGSGAHSWSLASGSLPAGLTLSSSGTLSGTPTSTSSASFTLRVTDGAATSSTRAFVVAAGLKITSQNLPEATTATPYSATLTGAGGTTPYSWSITSGTLPSGLSIAGGVISGTPSSAGTRVLVIRLTDAASRTVSSVITITVVDPLGLSNQTLPSGVVGSQYEEFLHASGGRPSYGWTLVSGSLPPGTRLTSSGWITGLPTAVGTTTSTVRATDRSGRTLTAGLTIVINPLAPTLTSLSPSSGSTSGGTVVTISGTNLTGATGVSFGGTAAASFSVLNATTVSAVSPARAAGQVDVAVTTPGGTTAAGAGSKFTYIVPTPTGISGAVSSASGPVRGAQVRVYSVTGASPLAVAVSAADGSWSIAIPAGTYEVQVVPPSGRHRRAWVGGATRSSATDLAVVAGSVDAGTTNLSVR